MNLVDFCVQQVINGPNEITDQALALAFDNPISGIGYPSWEIFNNDSGYSIEQGIREKVIYKMVAPLLHVTGGVTENLDLSLATITSMGNGFIHVNVPDALTGGRDILSIIKIYPGTVGALGFGGSSNQANCGVGQINDQMGRLVNALDGRTISGFTDTSRTGRNSFLIRTGGVTFFSLTAKVLLSYDDEFSIINPGAYPYFSHLVTLGVKAYIYKHCKRGLKEAVERHGYSFDDLQDEIDEYRGASAEFNEYYMEKIRKVLKYADPKGVSDHIAMISPRRIG